MTTGIPLPKMYPVYRKFSRQAISDIPAAIRKELSGLDLRKKIKPGETVAVTAGSRGIRDIDTITRTVIDYLKELGALPFIIPAMGSHGGATAEGQKDVLSRYNITEKSMGCEIRSSMEVSVIGNSSLGTPVYLDKIASEADHIVVINRIKPHTKMIGSIESGLIKMCLIGLGKHEGARTYHRAIDRFSWMQVIESVHDVLIEKSNIAFGLAILQNAYEETGQVSAVKPQDFFTEEPELLKKARAMMGSLPVKDIDLLIVDEMGKEISGTGMDTNITGRKEGTDMNVTHVFVRDLTETTHGNAQGIGLADFTTRRLVDIIDYDALYINSQTAYRTDSCKIPMTFDTDRDVMNTAVSMAGLANPDEYRIVWIKNTLELDTIYLSEAYINEIKLLNDLEISSEPVEITYDNAGNIISPFYNNH